MKKLLAGRLSSEDYGAGRNQPSGKIK